MNLILTLYKLHEGLEGLIFSHNPLWKSDYEIDIKKSFLSKSEKLAHAPTLSLSLSKVYYSSS